MTYPFRVSQAEKTKLKRIVSIIVLSLMGLLGVNAVDAQTKPSATPCKPGQQAPATGFWRWPASTRVRVYVRSVDFDPTHLAYLLTALNNWNAASEQTESGVRFDYQGNTLLEENSCENCLTILRGKVFDKVGHHAAELRAYSAGSDQIITYASIVVDPVLTNQRALLTAMLHELGHNLGLMDCYTCKRDSTVMNKFEIVNVPNGLDRPTSCDIAQVREAYKELKTRLASKKKPIPEDDGEEPIDDDTPVVVPAPTTPSGKLPIN
jgi:hypothetical protein